MARFSVTGMNCAACSARVEKAVRAVPGVDGCAMSLLTNEMSVAGSASDAAIVAAVEAAGYGAAPVQRTGDAPEPPNAEPARSALGLRLAASVALLAVLVAATILHANGLVQMALSGAILVLNGHFFASGFRGALRGAPNMDTLVALGAGSAFAWSVATLAFALPGEHLHFESAAMVVTLISVGKVLEECAKGRTTSALAALVRLAPKTATVVHDGREETIPAAQVRVGDVFLVRPGGNVPVDGVVEEGGGAVDESALTGESVPVDKAPGDRVSAATANVSGFLRCRATRVGEDTTLAQIVRLVRDAAATKAPIARLADRVAAVFVPAILLVSLLTLGVWLACGAAPGDAVARAVAVLVVSCPCALGLATPVAIVVGSGVGARRGILFKTAAAVEAAGRAKTVVLDKTGTITTGEPRVVSVAVGDGNDSDGRRVTGDELISFAAALERGSEHPLAKAIVRAADDRCVSQVPSPKFQVGRGSPGLATCDLRPATDRKAVEDFRALPGCGVEATIGGAAAFGGSVTAAEARGIALPPALRAAAEEAAAKGATPLVFARDGRALGLVAVADSLKPGAAEAIRALRAMDLRVVLLTGDNERTARAVAAEAGIDEVVAGVLPDGKHRVIEDLKKEGRVAMVGDGVNDAPALAAADLGLAIGAGTDVAIDAADAVLVHGRLGDVATALRLGRATLRTVRENLFWAFAYNVLLVPVAAGALVPLFGWSLTPGLCALVHGVSSVCVVLNALRLNRMRRP